MCFTLCRLNLEASNSAQVHKGFVLQIWCKLGESFAAINRESGLSQSWRGAHGFHMNLDLSLSQSLQVCAHRGHDGNLNPDTADRWHELKWWNMMSFELTFYSTWNMNQKSRNQALKNAKDRHTPQYSHILLHKEAYGQSISGYHIHHKRPS